MRGRRAAVSGPRSFHSAQRQPIHLGQSAACHCCGEVSTVFMYIAAMYRAFVIVLSLLFLTNTSVGLAWMPPCSFDGEPAPQVEEEVLAYGHAHAHTDCDSAQRQPTADPIDPQPESHCCDGLCFCAHAASSPNFAQLAVGLQPWARSATTSFPAVSAFVPSSPNHRPERPPASTS